MVREAIGLAVAGWLLAGRASNVPAPATGNPMLSEAPQCQRGGGWWRQSLAVCDTQGTGVEMRGR